MPNNKITVAYKKCGLSLKEVQEEVVANKSIPMNERINFVAFTNKIKQTLENKGIAESKEVVAND